MRLTSVRFVTDFFGLGKITTKTIAGITSDNKLGLDKIKSKYEPLLVARDKPANEEKTVDNNYGSVRFDSDNVALNHGQYEPNNTDPLYDTKLVKQIFLQSTNSHDIAESELGDSEGQAHHLKTTNPTLADVLQLFKTTQAKLTLKNKPPLTFEFNQNNIDDDKDEDVPEKIVKLSGKTEQVKPRLIIKKKKVLEIQEPIEKALKYNKEFDEPEDWHTESYEEPEVPEIKKHKEPINAYQYVKNVRDERSPFAYQVKLDSKGYHDFSDQVLDWSKVRHVDAVEMLRKSIIYDNYDVIAINKPYGLSSHSENRKHEPYNVNSLMQEVGREMRIEKLYLAHRLDKTTTGVLVFARTQERAKNLNKLFKGDHIKKTYLCITRGVPDPDNAIIDIPIGEFKVAGKLRSCLVPEAWPAEKQIALRYREARRAVTEYKVINQDKWVALVEVKPRSGVKHQIRCHMAFGLGTSILGDHKYSHLMKIAPQDLPVPLLKKLHLRQQKVRTLPIHLHSRTMVIPSVKADGQTLFINAPLPYHFVDNLKRLGLKYQE